MGRTNQRFKYTVEGQTLDTVDSEKDLGIIISSDLKSSNQCIQACRRASKVLGMITRNSSGDEIANVNFLYDDIVHAVKIQ